MLKFKLFATVAVVLALTSFGKADITSLNAYDDGDGALQCEIDWTDGVLAVDGIQAGEVGHIWADITTDTPEDPTIVMANSLDNDSGFAWTSYLVNVFLNKPFTISAPVVSTPGDWTAAITQAPVWNGTEYQGVVTYTGGTPVAVNDLFNFGYTIDFAGSTSYRFCQEMIPVPEPSTLVLLAMASLAFVVYRRRA